MKLGRKMAFTAIVTMTLTVPPAVTGAQATSTTDATAVTYAALHPSAAQIHAFNAGATPSQNAAIGQQLRRLPGGVRIGARQIAYYNGMVVYDVGPASLSDCPSGFFSGQWSCLYDDTNNNGRMLKFQDAGYLQSLVPYNFDNMTSSWANTRGQNAYLHDTPTGGGYALCLAGNSHSTSIPYNNTAGSIYLAKSTSGC